MVKIRYGKGETGWAEDLGDGQYRIDNIPLTDEGELVVSRRLGPQGDRPGIALVAHGADFDPVAAAREVGVENPEAFEA
jgi:hypothetical protein